MTAEANVSLVFVNEKFLFRSSKPVVPAGGLKAPTAGENYSFYLQPGAVMSTSLTLRFFLGVVFCKVNTCSLGLLAEFNMNFSVIFDIIK